MVAVIVAKENGIAVIEPFSSVFANLLLSFRGLVVIIQWQSAVDKDSGIGCHKLHAVPTDLVGATVDDEVYIVFGVIHCSSKY